MVKLFDEFKYWIQLVGMYGELGEECKQLVIMEIVYQCGFVNIFVDVFNMVQFYYYYCVFYKGVKLMEQVMNDGVLEKNLCNFKFLG